MDVKEQWPEHNGHNGIVHWLLFGWHSYNTVPLTAVKIIFVQQADEEPPLSQGAGHRLLVHQQSWVREMHGDWNYPNTALQKIVALQKRAPFAKKSLQQSNVVGS